MLEGLPVVPAAPPVDDEPLPIFAFVSVNWPPDDDPVDDVAPAAPPAVLPAVPVALPELLPLRRHPVTVTCWLLELDCADVDGDDVDGGVVCPDGGVLCPPPACALTPTASAALSIVPKIN